MSPVVSIVAVSGSLHSPSKTTVLVREILEGFADRTRARVRAPTSRSRRTSSSSPTSGASSRARSAATSCSPLAEDALRRIESATLLIVASPVYRASFTGLFKHVFDFVGQYALIDKPVLLAATGGSDRHALIIEHQFRPLFSFFQAITLPIGVYASDTDFVDYRIDSTGAARAHRPGDRPRPAGRAGDAARARAPVGALHRVVAGLARSVTGNLVRNIRLRVSSA